MTYYMFYETRSARRRLSNNLANQCFCKLHVRLYYSLLFFSITLNTIPTHKSFELQPSLSVLHDYIYLTRKVVPDTILFANVIYFFFFYNSYYSAIRGRDYYTVIHTRYTHACHFSALSAEAMMKVFQFLPRVQYEYEYEYGEWPFYLVTCINALFIHRKLKDILKRASSMHSLLINNFIHCH